MTIQERIARILEREFDPLGPRTQFDAIADVLAQELGIEPLLAVATLYVESFAQDEAMSLTERMRLQEIEDVLARNGRRY